MKIDKLSHRPRLFTLVTGGPIGYTFSGNAGFSDGSVAYYEYRATGMLGNGKGIDF